MSTIPRKFFSGALPRRPAPTAGIGAVDARALCIECIACARCVFAEHLNKGIFFAMHLRVARSAVAHRCALKTPKRSLTDRFGIHEPPTTGSPIRHRTTRFAQKLRKLFPPASGVADARNAPDGDVEACERDSCSRASHAEADANRGWKLRAKYRRPNAGIHVHTCMSLRITPLPKRERSAAAETAMPARSDPAGIVYCVC
jgi:hypothetical protein